MSEFGNQIIFKQLLDRHQRIRVPMIQRDYVQGRETEEEVREDFLSALYGALSLEPGDESLPLNLDFIYGSVEGDEETQFLPLDGQQRLTTLFLLHWYLAWKDGRYDEFKVIFSPEGDSRFSYSVRPSSKEFFDALVNYYPDRTPDDVTSLRRLITNQSWYFRYWRLDPTIQASLTMLEAIHKHFGEAVGFFQRLVDEEQPAITFQLLDLENFGLSDDLYIKMNARGKPLTAFETFKARYEQVLEAQFGDETRMISGHAFRVADYFSRRMDTQWANFFWAHRDNKTNLFDDAVMNLFRVVALVSRDPKSDSYIDDIRALRNSYTKSSFSIFYDHGWLDRYFSETLFLLLETWSDEGSDFVCHLPNTQFFNEEAIFAKIVSSPTALRIAELVQLVGYIAYLQEDANDVELFQEWMRIVFNLTVNTSYDRPEDMQRSVAGLQKLARNSNSILKYFSTTDKPATGFSREQIIEERLKAGLIIANDGWRPLIDRAENHGYFRGQIDFLLDFCGAVEKWKNNEVIDWEDHMHEILLQNFENYLNKAELMFDSHGLAGVSKFRWERALLSIDNYTLQKGPNYSFLVNSSTEPASWKRLLRDNEKRQVLKKLWDQLNQDISIEEQLDVIINSATELEPWIEQFVRTSEAIEYCKRREYRWYDENSVYLMSKSQMNGMHAELFTYCLYHNWLKNMVNDDALSPLNFVYYSDVNVTDVEPCISLSCRHDDYHLVFKIEYHNGRFVIKIEGDWIEEHEIIYALLAGELGYKKTNNYLFKENSYSGIQNNLTELALGLSALISEEDSDAS